MQVCVICSPIDTNVHVKLAVCMFATLAVALEGGALMFTNLLANWHISAVGNAKGK